MSHADDVVNAIKRIKEENLTLQEKFDIYSNFVDYESDVWNAVLETTNWTKMIASEAKIIKDFHHLDSFYEDIFDKIDFSELSGEEIFDLFQIFGWLISTWVIKSKKLSINEMYLVWEKLNKDESVLEEIFDSMDFSKLTLDEKCFIWQTFGKHGFAIELIFESINLEKLPQKEACDIWIKFDKSSEMVRKLLNNKKISNKKKIEIWNEYDNSSCLDEELLRALRKSVRRQT